MRLVSFIILNLIYSLPLIGQQTVDYYQLVSKEIESNQLGKADSLLTVLINLSPTKDNFYNRAQIRKARYDSCGYCEDLKVAYKFYSDEGARIEFGQNCFLKSDSTYYSKKFEQVSSTGKYRFIEIVSKSICETNLKGQIIDIKHKYDYMGVPPIDAPNLFKVTLFTTNIYANYIIKDSIKIYTHVYLKHPKHTGSDYEITKSIIKNLVLNSGLNTEFKDDILIIAVVLSPEGEILSVDNNLIKYLDKVEYKKLNANFKLVLKSNFDYPKTVLFNKAIYIEYFHTFNL